nr:BTAD domain-containing putative transcriptional regulator [bacterium]
MAAVQPLSVQMFGGFSLTYGDKSIDDQSNRSKRLLLLLEYLITFRDRSISQEELIDLLWPNEESEDPANALKTLLHRVRSAVGSLGVADRRDIILYHRGSYCWNPHICCQVDVDGFDQLVEAGDAPQADDATRLAAYLKAIALYRGDFLPKASSEPWAISIYTYYHNAYLRVVHAALDLLDKDQRWDEMIGICRQAINIDPYDEKLHYCLISTLVSTGNMHAAKAHYEYVTDLFYNHFGVTPSPELTRLYREVVKTSNSLETDLNIIKENLREKERVSGALFCEYEFFKEIYQLEARSAARTGRVVYIALMTLTDAGGNPLEKRILQNAMERLIGSVQGSLRRGDVFTRYSVSQLLLMLPTNTFESAEMVLQRLIKKFTRDFPRLPVSIHHKVQMFDPLP